MAEAGFPLNDFVYNATFGRDNDCMLGATFAAAKHGVVRLVRSLSASLPTTHGISISVVCPWMVATAMVGGAAADAWQRAGLPLNQPGDVARMIVGLACQG